MCTCNCKQVEARGNALERLREENEGLTTDYNRLRERLSAKEAEVQAAGSAMRDMEQQFRAARSSAGLSLPDVRVPFSGLIEDSGMQLALAAI